ncbi:hypothetical protein BGZ83_007323 [Gryganskiella cystojenkinii]|nr:hypothetical protein BGZ83_007323 [Gryganskiella cystojenkinii]
MKNAYTKDDNYAAGIQVGIELTKRVDDYNSRHAILRPLSASLSSRSVPVMGLTDLNSCFCFFRPQPREIMSRTFGLLDGVALFEAIAGEPFEVGRGSRAIATLDTPYRARCLFKDAIPGTDGEIVMSPEGSASAEQAAAWAAGSPFQAPLSTSAHPILALTTLTAGLFFAAKFGIAEKPVLSYDLATAIPSSVLLGFGTVFLFLAVGLYV